MKKYFLKLIASIFSKLFFKKSVLILEEKIKIFPNTDLSKEKMKKINELLYEYKEATKIRMTNIIMDRLSPSALAELGLEIDKNKLQALQKKIIMHIESDIEHVASGFIERLNR